MIDTHCHLELMQNMQQMISETEKSSMQIFSVGTTPRAFEQMHQFCNGNEKIHVGLGLHPQLVDQGTSEIDLFRQKIGMTRFVGEVGLDFSEAYYSSNAMQQDAFRNIAQMCHELGGKVLSIHSVQSVDRVFSILNEENTFDNNICIFHWYSGSVTFIRKIISAGGYFSINPRMFSSTNGRKIIDAIPIDRILLESDAPFTLKMKNVAELDSYLSNALCKTVEIKGQGALEAIQKNEMMILEKLEEHD